MDLGSSIGELLKDLVRLPSRAGIDPYGPILERLKDWLGRHNVPTQHLTRDGETVGLVAIVEGAAHAPIFMLNATLDTAGFGTEERWTAAPTSAAVRNGWLYGRGSADSKAGVAIFAHVAAELVANRESWAGQLVLLFDLDEHTGNFGGVRRYFECGAFPTPDGVFIGYPGNDRLVVGSRGFARAVVTVHGRSAHSGGTSNRGVNAVTRAAQLALELSGTRLREGQANDSESFGLPPQLTITEIRGGQGFSMVPDECLLSVDVRLTPSFGVEDARRVCLESISRLDSLEPECPATRTEWLPSWPAYRISDQHPIVRALRSTAEDEFQRLTPTAVVGPSNVGNYLQSLGVAATCGFGATYRNIHATDECVELASLEPVYRAYRGALQKLFVRA